MHCFLRYLVAFCLFNLALPGLAQSLPVQVVIVSSESSSLYVDAGKGVVDGLENGGLPPGAIELMSPDELARRVKTGQLGAPRVFIGLGTRATQSLLSSGVSAPILSALIPRRSFEQILHSSGRHTSNQLSALYLDQPLRRQLALLSLALPQIRQVGVLLGPDSVAKLPELRALAQDRGFVLRHAEVQTDQALFPALREALEGSDAFLALADPLVFNSTSIQNILLSSFRARVPMLAFSPGYGRAGAVLSLYASPAQIGNQVARVVLAALRSGHLPEQPIEPDDFLVDVNMNVARAFGLALDGAVLRQSLRRMEYLP